MSNFEIWKMSYEYGWATIEQLKEVVITSLNPNGEITIEQFEEITGQKFN